MKNKTFEPPKKQYYLGRVRHGTPHFYPWNYVPSFIEIAWTRNCDIKRFKQYSRAWKKVKFKLFDIVWYLAIGSPVHISNISLGWKDKYGSPRLEWVPQFHIYFFLWQFSIFWCSQDGNDDKYYEMLLWYEKYCDSDLKKAEDTWGWIDYKTKLSTWNKEYINYDK